MPACTHVALNLFEHHGELGEVRNGGNAATVLRELLQTTFELVESGQPKEVHLVVGWFLERLENIAQSQTQEHVAAGGGGGERKEGNFMRTLLVRYTILYMF